MTRRRERGLSCTVCTASRPRPSRSRCRSAEDCGERPVPHVPVALPRGSRGLRQLAAAANRRPSHRADRSRARGRGGVPARPAQRNARRAMRLGCAERPGHRNTTRHAQAIYPFISPGGLGGQGVFIGRDSSGGAFCFDPWALYAQGALDDPNLIVIGKLGQGKSALVKTLLWRMLLFGRRAFVLDVKREYGPLCASAGVKPISLSPGGGVRLNPLAARPEEHAQIELLRAIATTAVGEPINQLEAAALREALRTVRRHSAEPTLPEIAAVLFTPPAAMADALETTPVRLADEARR